MEAQEFIQQIDSMTVLELTSLVKTLEDHYGVSAAAAAMPVAAAGGAAAGAAAEEEKDRVRRRPHRHRRQEDQRHQGGPRGHQPRSQGGQGARGVGARSDQGGRAEGRGRRDQEEVRRGRSAGRGQVSGAFRRSPSDPRAERTRPPGPALSRARAASAPSPVRIMPGFPPREARVGRAWCRFRPDGSPHPTGSVPRPSFSTRLD